MEPKATPHRAACKRWGMVGGGAGRGGLSNARGVHGSSAGWRAEVGASSSRRWARRRDAGACVG